MGGNKQLQQELGRERQALTEALGVLREDLAEATGKAKRAPAALGGAVALGLVAKRLVRVAKRRR